ncbi:MAG: 23S rRNA (guanosine2251-2'-O)-methyltransferase [Candidatus Paceibacteria bacterium]|jgi:tRNA G18 (ribose-2'-O)-methylase SpoU
MKYLILENIRSAHNVGAMFRTADGAGVDKIFLVGYTPTPIDRFGRPQSEISKTSLGACDVIPWEQFQTSTEVVMQLQSEGFVVAAVELTEGSISLKAFKVPPKVAYLMGNEVVGVEEETVKVCDVVVDLPMLGVKESLNVATTAGIVMYHDLLQK